MDEYIIQYANDSVIDTIYEYFTWDELKVYRNVPDRICSNICDYYIKDA